MGNVLVDSFKGALFLGFFILMFYGFYFVFKKMGVVDKIKKKRRSNPPKEICDAVEEILEVGTFKDFAEYISKYDEKKQKLYIDAYTNIKDAEMKSHNIPVKKQIVERRSKKHGRNNRTSSKT